MSTNKRRRIVGTLIAMAIFLSLAACGSGPSIGTPQDPPNSGVRERIIKLTDGRTVVCITHAGVGGIDCDWDHAK